MTTEIEYFIYNKSSQSIEDNSDKWIDKSDIDLIEDICPVVYWHKLMKERGP